MSAHGPGRRAVVFEVVKKGCVDTLSSLLASTAAKDAARKRLFQLLDQDRRGGVG